MNLAEFVKRYPPVQMHCWQLGPDEPVLTLDYSAKGMLGPHINYRRTGWQAIRDGKAALSDANCLGIFRFPLGFNLFRDPWKRCAKFLSLEVQP